MKELLEHLQYLIRRHDEVTIPGFGAMKGIVLPAFLDEETGRVLIEPTRTIYFEEEDVRDGSLLVDSYMRRHRFNREEANSIVEESVRMLKGTLLKNGMLMAGRLGQFYQRGSRIDFKPSLNGAAYSPFTLLKSDSKPSIENDRRDSGKAGWGRKLRSMAVVGSLITFATHLFSHSA